MILHKLKDETMHTDQQITIFTSEDRTYSSLDKALQSAAMSFQNCLNTMNSEGLNPNVISVSHSSGYSNYTGYFASIVAVINVDKKTA